MIYDLVLKNGILVDAKNNINGKMNLGIIDGKIAEISADHLEAKEVIDVNGDTIIPGIIDMHTHVTRKFGGGLGSKMVAETGVTTTIDFAGPITDLHMDIKNNGYGLNIGSIEAIIPDGNEIKDENPSNREIDEFLEKAMENGALGLKLFGGHDPLTPESTKLGIDIANDKRALVALHAGTTATGSDMNGVREAFEMAKNKKLLLAHINAYCRGRIENPYDEMKEVFNLLKENKNVCSDSHLAVMNGTIGFCQNNVPTDYVTKICLELYKYPVTENGLKQAILDGIVKVIKTTKDRIELLKGYEACEYWISKSTNVAISFPVNLPQVGVSCMVEKTEVNGDFLIPMASTDGGGIPRNNLVKRMFSMVQLGYLTVEDVVRKSSLNPAEYFGLVDKGHFSKGADADITIVNLKSSEAVMSVVNGKINMINGIVLEKEGRLLVTERGVAKANKLNILYDVVDLEKSLFYKS